MPSTVPVPDMQAGTSFENPAPGVVNGSDNAALQNLPTAGEALTGTPPAQSFATEGDMEAALSAGAGSATATRRDIRSPILVDELGMGAQQGFDQNEFSQILQEVCLMYDNTLAGRGHNPVRFEDLFAFAQVFPMGGKTEMGRWLDHIKFAAPVQAYMTGLRFNRHDIQRPNGPRPEIVPQIQALSAQWGPALARTRFGHFLDVFRKNMTLWDGLPMFTDAQSPHIQPGNMKKTFVNDFNLDHFFANVLAPTDQEIENLIVHAQAQLITNNTIQSQATVAPEAMDLILVVDRIELWQAFYSYLHATDIVTQGTTRTTRRRANIRLIYDLVGPAEGSGSGLNLVFMRPNQAARCAGVIIDLPFIQTEWSDALSGEMVLKAWNAWGVIPMYGNNTVRYANSFGG